VVATADRLDALEACLQSLATCLEPYACSVDVVVVDNGAHPVAPVVRRLASGSAVAFTVERSSRGNLAMARNMGLQASSSAIVAFTDDDCRVTPAYAHRVGQVVADQASSFWFGPITLGDTADAPIGIDEDTSSWLLGPGSLVRPGVAQGANLVVRRSTALAIGGFDPRLGAGTRFRCEDLDFVARLLRSGAAGRHVGDLHVEHHHGRRLGSRAHRTSDVANAFAVGAFYAKQHLDGDARYGGQFGARLCSTAGRYGRRIDIKAAELAGAMSYSMRRAVDEIGARVRVGGQR